MATALQLRYGSSRLNLQINLHAFLRSVFKIPIPFSPFPKKASYHRYQYAVDLRSHCVRVRSRAGEAAARGAAAARSAVTATGTEPVREPWRVILEDWNVDTNT